MRKLISVGALALLLGGLGCGSNDPYCGEFDDSTGRAIAYCPNPRQDPVCDEPGDEAHFEEGTAGWMLVGGAYARCDEDREVACPTDTVGEPYCITDPEL